MKSLALTEDLASVLRTIALTDLSTPSSIARACGKKVSEQLDALHASGLVMRQAARSHDGTRTTLYSLSASGRDQLNAYDSSFAARMGDGGVAAPRIAHLTTVGLYMGAELRPFDGRLGAMDAFALPSRMGDRLHYRDGSVQTMEQQNTPAQGNWLALATPPHTNDGRQAAESAIDVGVLDFELELGPVTLMQQSPDCVGYAYPVSGRQEGDAC